MRRFTSANGLVTLLLAALAVALMAPPDPAHAAAPATILVHDSTELLAALDARNAGRRIRVLPGDYAITSPLIVPDGVLLEGSGVMGLADGLPSGFEPGTETTLRVASAFEGDLLTLGNGSIISGLRLIDIAPPPVTAAPRPGNVLVLGSRAPGDSVAAEIRDCEIVNPQPSGVLFDGPSGRAIVILTRNPAREQSPPPHEGARVSLLMSHSIVRSADDGGALFAINFAARGEVSVKFEDNRVEGSVSIAGGASRPDLVAQARTSLESSRNLYVRNPGGTDKFGWRVVGGSSAHIPGLASPGASSNVARVHSIDDRIEDFKVGIQAAAGRRWLDASGPVSDNLVELDLERTRVRTEGQDAADFVFQGAFSEAAPGVGREFPAGDRNVTRIRMRNVIGSPAVRANQYADASGPALADNKGVGNRLEILGGAADFARNNTSISVAPPAEFFTGKQ